MIRNNSKILESEPIIILPNIIKDRVKSSRELEVLIFFYKKWLNSHPNLTKNERIISGLIILGYNSLEIASLCNSTNNSVEVARTRLRKKIGITNQPHSLFEYLVKI